MANPWGAPDGYGGQQPTYDYNNNNTRPNYSASGGYAPHFQAPPTMPGAQIHAPVIRIGMDNRRDQQGYGDSDGRNNRGPRGGVGADYGGPRHYERDRHQNRDSMIVIQPPTREEVARTIFIGGLGASAPPDEVIESILRSAGKLRRWTRPRDANDKKCRFGFAEYEDVDSLEGANELFAEGLQVPIYADGKMVIVEGENAAPEMTQLPVVVDEQSLKYIDEWMSTRNETEDVKQFRVDGAKEDLRQCMSSLLNARAFGVNGELGEGDTAMEIIEIPVNMEDELADIPAELRATVAQEIKRFRDRSIKRDQMRIQQEDEEIEALRSRDINHHASPTHNTNGTSAVVGAPSGPKGYRGAQLPSDYANGVAFVSADLPPEDDSDASDTELENRRKATKLEEQGRQYLDAERRWLNRERQRIAAQERERTREELEARERERQKTAMARRLSAWDDEAEERNGREEYYYDRSSWARKRAAHREREAREDDRDRSEMLRERPSTQHFNDARGGEGEGYDSAPAKQSGPSGFQISFTGAGRNKAATQSKIDDAAWLLEDEEEAEETGRHMTAEERRAARLALATEIPMDTESLFNYEIRWSYITPALLEREIRPFLEQKVVDLLSIQEDFVVDMVFDAIKEQKPPRELIAQLEPALEAEAEVLVKKVWRLIVYHGEAEGRGLN